MLKRKALIAEAFRDHFMKMVEDEEFSQYNGYSCGYFTVKSLVRYLGNGYTKNLVRDLGMTQDGVRQYKMVKVLRERGVSASVYYDMKLRQMKRFLRAGRKIIIYHHELEHWMVLSNIQEHTGGYHNMVIYDPQRHFRNRKYYDLVDNLCGFGIVCGKKN